jgi:hypothetical protein
MGMARTVTIATVLLGVSLAISRPAWAAIGCFPDPCLVDPALCGPGTDNGDAEGNDNSQGNER